MKTAWPYLAILLGGLLGGAVAVWWLPPSAGPAAIGAPEPGPSRETPEEVVISDQPQPPETTPLLLPTEAARLYCSYRFAELPAAAPLRVTWRVGGKDLGELPLTEHRRARGAGLAGQFALLPPEPGKPFPPGLYQLAFHSGEQVVLETSYVLAPQAAQILAQQPPAPGELRVVSLGTFRGVDPEGPAPEPADRFAPTERVVAVFTYLGGRRGMQLQVRWLAAGERLEQATGTVELGAAAGRAQAWLQAGGEGLPPGPYSVQVHAAGDEQPLAAAAFTVADR